MSTEEQGNNRQQIPEGDREAIEYFKQALAQGENWYTSLLEAIKLWTSAEEEYDDRHWRYLIDSEAFDWLLLAERLLKETGDSVPEDEKMALLFHDSPPQRLSKDEMKSLMGAAKYRAYLNFLYGILVEEALISAVMNEVRKEKRVFGGANDEENLSTAYNRIYGATQQVLLDEFRKEKRYPRPRHISLGEIKEFMYWLFKYRLKHSDKSRMASDTKKAMLHMEHKMRMK